MAQQVGNWNPPLAATADEFGNVDLGNTAYGKRAGGSNSAALNDTLTGAVSSLAGGKQMNIGDLERLASVVAGGAALFLLSRRLLLYLSLALGSIYLLYRGLTGYCALYDRTHVNTRNIGPKLAGDYGVAERGVAERGVAEGLVGGFQPVADEVREEWRENGHQHDRVDEASWQSFPASDPPGAA